MQKDYLNFSICCHLIVTLVQDNIYIVYQSIPDMQQTTIKLNPMTKAELDKFKQYENESYDELVRKLVRIVWMCKKQPSLSRKAINEIEEAREQIKKGEFYTEEEVKKILGLRK